MRTTKDSLSLHSAGYDATLPFHIFIDCDGRSSELICLEALRIMPGRRLVCNAEWNNQQVVAKFFLGSNAGRQARREKRGFAAFKEAGIKTPELLFYGKVSPDASIVIGFQKILNARDFDVIWKQIQNNERECIKFLKLAMAAIGDLHMAGLKQDDLHLGNFLVAGDDIYTIDCGTIDTRSLGKPLSKKKSLENIEMMFSQFHPRFDHLIARAFQEYIRRRKWLSSDTLYAQMTKEIRRQRTHRKRKYLRKIFRECTAFKCIKTFHHFVVCERSFYTGEVSEFISDPDHYVDSGKLLKKGNSSTVSLVEFGGKPFIVKRYNIKGFWHGLKRSVRPSRAWVSWRNAHLLSFILNIPTPQPVMFMEKRRGPFRSTAYHVTKYVEGVNILEFFYDQNSKNHHKKVAQQMIHLFQSLADASISHGDFKGTNFIFTGKEVMLIDLDAMSENRFKWRFRARFKNDIRRFLENWNDLPEIRQSFQNRIHALKI